MKHKLHKLETLRAPWMWPTFKAETCRGVNQQIQKAVQQGGGKFYICNVVARKKNVYLSSLMMKVPDHVYVFREASNRVSWYPIHVSVAVSVPGVTSMLHSVRDVTCGARDLQGHTK
jgi:hypothetical protein